MCFGVVEADEMQQAQNQSRVPYSQVGGYMPNGTPSGPSSSFQQNQARVVQQGPVRVLCIADVRGQSPSIELNWKFIADVN